MALILEAVEGGRRVTLGAAQRVSIGRTEKARIVFPDDSFLSGLHFVLHWDGKACSVESLGANPTFVNGSPVEQAEILDGYRITAGQSSFTVRLLQPPDQAAGSLILGSWSLAHIPQGWELVEGIGLRRAGGEDFRPNVVFGEDALEQGQTLEEYIDRQLLGAKAYFGDEAEFELLDAEAFKVVSADETAGLIFRYGLKGPRRVRQRQIYARRERALGIVTLTAPETEAAALESPLSLRRGLEFREPAPPKPQRDGEGEAS